MPIKNRPDVWVVIPTWNRVTDLIACLESLEKVNYSPLHILVVDNASQDNTTGIVSEKFPDVHLLTLEENKGAPQASNIGFEYTLNKGADFVLRLDSDTVVSPDFLTPLVSKMIDSPEIGVISPKIYYYEPPDVLWYAGVDAHPFHFGATHDLQNQKDSTKANQSRIVDYAWGAAMLIRREVLEKTGGFDPQFFIYYEEIDFCQRIQDLGYHIYYLAESEIWHKVGIQHTNGWTAYQWNRSKMILFRKHARNLLHKISLILYAITYAFISPVIKGNNTGNRGPLRSALKGLYDGFRLKLS